MCRAESCCLLTPPCAVSVVAAMPSHQLLQPMRPRLPRKLANSARINLNKYWNVLEELMPVSSPRKVFDESDTNAINENIDNERKLAAMQLTEAQGSHHGAPPTTTLSTIHNIGKQPSSSSSSTSVAAGTANPEDAESLSFGVSNSSPSAMSEDEMSADENTPPSNSHLDEFSR